MWRPLAPALVLAALPSLAAGDEAGEAYAHLPGGEFRTALRYEDTPDTRRVAPFLLMRRPVTNAEFLAFVQAHPQWQRGRAPAALAEARYLTEWSASLEPGGAAPLDAPVTWVSWFAAQAYCESQGARLPTWQEWEFAAAADESRPDARRDPAWQERILAWYSQPTSTPLPAVGARSPNAYGIHDLHGLVWEWVDDASALLVSGDNREQGAADRLRFCGAGALSVDDRENYATLMRVALLSSLRAQDATANLGFRCAKDAP